MDYPRKYGKYDPSQIVGIERRERTTRTTRPQQQSADFSLVASANENMTVVGIFEHDGALYQNCVAPEGEAFALKIDNPVLVWGADYARLIAEGLREHDRHVISLFGLTAGMLPIPARHNAAPAPEEPKEEAPDPGQEVDAVARTILEGMGITSTIDEERAAEALEGDSGASATEQQFEMPESDARTRPVRTIVDASVFGEQPDFDPEPGALVLPTPDLDMHVELSDDHVAR